MKTTTPRATSLWNEHQDWGSCTGCPLHQHRFKIVLGRGTLPAPLLFIGEAPGPDENILGEPFVGPAGKLFDSMLEAAIKKTGYASTSHKSRWNRPFSKNDPTRLPSPLYAITNIVACFPQKSPQGDFREPAKDEAKACQQRLLEFIAICKPLVIVTLGRIAEKYLPQLQSVEVDKNEPIGFRAYRRGVIQHFKLVHPSHILRMSGEHGKGGDPNRYDLAYKRFVLDLVQIFQRTRSLQREASHAG